LSFSFYYFKVEKRKEETRMRMDGLLCLVFSFLPFLLIEKKRERKGNETDRSPTETETPSH